MLSPHLHPVVPFSLKRLAVLFVLLFCVPISVVAAWSYASGWPQSWRTADWSSTGIAPDPALHKDAIIQVYSARAGRWKGVISVHTWIAFKARDESRFSRFDVVGWGRMVRQNSRPVDGRWYGNVPEVIYELRGDRAQALIPKIRAAIAKFDRVFERYRVWPGPNSNTFVAWIGREVPELGLEMPANALGKDYLGYDTVVSSTPSGSGWQVSMWGVLGFAIGVREGIEIHVLGTTVGLDFDDVAVKLPGVGALSLVALWGV